MVQRNAERESGLRVAPWGKPLGEGLLELSSMLPLAAVMRRRTSGLLVFGGVRLGRLMLLLLGRWRGGLRRSTRRRGRPG